MLDGDPKIFGLFGDPVAHSLSPCMHNAAFRAEGLPYHYLPFRVRSGHLAHAVQAIMALGMAGANVTAPHKEAIVPYLDRLSPEAELLGAVNTVVDQDGGLKGFNTDVEGFLYLLHNITPPLPVKGEKVCLFGAGGAAKAVSLALAKAGAGHLTIFNRTLERGEALRERLCKHKLCHRKEMEVRRLEKNAFHHIGADFALIINCLSVDPFESGLFSGCVRFSSLKAVIDLRYSPADPPLLKWASRNGHSAVNGMAMLLGQGMKSFELFTGRKAPLAAMKNALAEACPERER
jgi:shikimate dehydrogenase